MTLAFEQPPARQAELQSDPPGNGFGYHAWAEIWVGRWIAVDPTQGTMAADATHVQLAGGDLAEQAKITMLIGKLKAQIERAN